MASPVGKEHAGPTDGVGDVGSDVATARPAVARDSGGEASVQPKSTPHQDLVPTQGPAALVAGLDFELDDDFELPSVLRPDPPAPPRWAPRLMLSQLSPVRSRREQPPIVTAMPSGDDDLVTSGKCALADEQAVSHGLAAPLTASLVPANETAPLSETSAAPAIAPQSPEPRSADANPLQSAAQAKVSMSFLDTRMRRMAEAAHAPMHDVAAGAPPAPTVPDVAISDAVPMVPHPCAVPLSASSMMPPPLHPAAPPLDAVTPLVPSLQHASTLIDIDPFAILPQFDPATAPGETSPPPLPALPFDPVAYADVVPVGVLGQFEGQAADLLRPLLREWLSENMPRIVEKALCIEIARAAGEPPETAG